MDQLPLLGKRELICLLFFTCNNVVSVLRGFLFLWVPGMGYVILLWHSLSLPYNYFSKTTTIIKTEPNSFEIDHRLRLCVTSLQKLASYINEGQLIARRCCQALPRINQTFDFHVFCRITF